MLACLGWKSPDQRNNMEWFGVCEILACQLGDGAFTGWDMAEGMVWLDKLERH